MLVYRISSRDFIRPSGSLRPARFLAMGSGIRLQDASLLQIQPFRNLLRMSKFGFPAYVDGERLLREHSDTCHFPLNWPTSNVFTQLATGAGG